jgi:hypothetical protein
MRFSFTVEAEVERITGRFATRDELLEQVREAIESADPRSLTGENEGEYEVQEWTVTEEEEPSREELRRRAALRQARLQVRDLLNKYGDASRIPITRALLEKLALPATSEEARP